jgi:hypothetical protein
MGSYPKRSENIAISFGLVDNFIDIYATIVADRRFGFSREPIAD